MHKLIIPIKNLNVTDENREYTLSLLRRAECTRILLTWVDGRESDLSLMKKNIKFFQDNGLEVGIWVGETIGHGSALLNGLEIKNQQKYQNLISINGDPIPKTFCPLDKNFQKDFGKKLAELAKTGADMILLDDDLRLSLHGANGSGISCTCPAHMAKIREYCGEDISREQLKSLAFSGAPNKYRDAWLRAQGESIYEIASAWRTEVDKVAPNVPLAVCSVYCHWDIDGVDAEKLTDILSGKGNKKYLRLQGAPYWACHSDYSLIGMIEISRMFSSFCKRDDIEIWSEGDVYPRPRYNIPASCLELYDLGTRIDGGYNGILKYIFDYSARPDYEVGYIDLHCKNKTLINDIANIFEGGANKGVKVVCAPHMIGGFDLSIQSSMKEKSPYPYAGILLGSASIPTVYSGEGITNAAFGEYVKLLSEDDRKKGCITDAVGAITLTGSGIDVGISDIGEFTSGNATFLVTKEPQNLAALTKSEGSFLSVSLNEGAEPLLYAIVNGKETLLAYRYENPNGERFIVYLFDANTLYRRSGILQNYTQQKLLQDNIPWLSGSQLPVVCEKNPQLYLMTRQEEDSLSVALLNCFADEVLYPTLKLSETYSSVECFGCEAKLEGDKVTIISDFPANRFAAIRLTK